ncbi:hypothetical protein T4B_11277 [Trichinella pseudospiralis]|uniref:Uncharacterized protein n=1 Tax=Trichinella pseudospiralis TaxID=6337 RepID=A0A0V1IK46_TRIPS|nr:hypothetical protein T4B_11277 [Trichinella pseudospiralis]
MSTGYHGHEGESNQQPMLIVQPQSRTTVDGIFNTLLVLILTVAFCIVNAKHFQADPFEQADNSFSEELKISRFERCDSEVVGRNYLTRPNSVCMNKLLLGQPRINTEFGDGQRRQKLIKFMSASIHCASLDTCLLEGENKLVSGDQRCSGRCPKA